MPEIGDVIPGVGVIVRCPDCQGAGWTRHPTLSGTRLMCARCVGNGHLCDDGA